MEMETLFIVCGLTVLALLALGLLINDSPPPPPPSLGVCSPSDSPYVPTPSQPSSYHQPLHPQLLPPRSAIRYPHTPSQYSTLQAPSSSQPSPYQPHRLPVPSAQYPPLATTPLLSRDASVPKPVCYTPQQPSRPAARVQQVPVVPVVIASRERPTARVPEVPVVSVVIDPYEDPISLRLKARQEGDQMGKCFKERNEARASNERQRAKVLTQRGEAHKVNRMLLDKEASAKIFKENNQNRRANEVDLHGLYVSEALTYFDDAVQGVRDRGESSLCVIVGKGNHSDNNTPKIKPAVQAHGKSLGLPIEVDPRNDGCLIVSFK